MGSSKVALMTDADSRREYYRHLMDDMTALQLMLEQGKFESDVQRIGFELELSFYSCDAFSFHQVADDFVSGNPDFERFSVQISRSESIEKMVRDLD